MLVCVYYCAFGTRDRGCSRHPAFPAPSGLRVRTRNWQNLGQIVRRERERMQRIRRVGKGALATCPPSLWRWARFALPTLRNQHRACRTHAFTNKIGAPMDAIGTIDIGKTRRAEHHAVAWRRSAKGMRGGIGVMIGLDLDDDAADAVDQKRRADQIGRDLMHA